MDWIPGISQVKSLVQLVCLDVEGAIKTQEIFAKECPGVSQITSTVQWISGDPAGALETQKRCGKGLLRIVDGIPVVGHTKGLIHYACGDTQGGHQAMKSASRTVGVIGGGAGGFLVGGPVGAVAGGIAGGATLDGVTTGIESAVREEFSPSGYIAAVSNVVKGPSAGNVFDLAMMPIADAFSGYSVGKVVGNIQTALQPPLSNPPPGSAGLTGNQVLAVRDFLHDVAEADVAAGGPQIQYINPLKAAEAWHHHGTEPVAVPLKPVQGVVVIATDVNRHSMESQKEIQVWLLLESAHGLAIVGSSEVGNNLTTALLWDHPMCITIFTNLGFDWQNIWKTETLSLDTVVEFLLEVCAAKGYDKEMITGLVQQWGHKGKEAVKMLLKDLVDKLQDLSHPEAKRNAKGTSRGEDVINKGILSVYRDIIDRFLQTTALSMDSIGLASDCELLHNYNHPVDTSTRNLIENDLVARIPVEVVYIDTNTVLYGTATEILRGYAIQHMTSLYKMDRIEPSQGSQWTQPLLEVLALINENLLFVDNVALEYWQRKYPQDAQKYLNAKQAVENMFTQLYEKLRDWVLHVKRVQE